MPQDEVPANAQPLTPVTAEDKALRNALTDTQRQAGEGPLTIKPTKEQKLDEAVQEFRDGDPPQAGGRRVISDPMLRWFAFDHLPLPLQETSAPFHHLAVHIVGHIKPGPERAWALRHLLQAKDAAVRAVVHPGG